MRVALQPAGSPASRIHYRDTIESPVDLTSVRLMLGPDESELTREFPDGRAPMWGVTPGKRDANVPKYRKLQSGDRVLFLRDRRAFAQGEIALLFRNPDLAESLWGRDNSGQTWEYMYALKSVEEIDVSYEALRAALDSKAGDNFMGFRVVDGERARNVLALLGLAIESEVDASWTLEIGETIRRVDLHAEFGGASRGGIEPSASTPNVFLFSDPSTGARYGYDYDGPGADGDFYFTGDGQVGDQRPDQGGNKSLLDAERDGRAIRLFTKDKTDVTYMGEYELADPPYEVRPGMDRNRNPRQVLVFHLLPVDVDERLVSMADSDLRFLPKPVERSNVLHFDMATRSLGRRSMRRESVLRDAYVLWAQARGLQVLGGRIHLPGRKEDLVIDLYDETSKRVIEAKSSASRMHVRSAIGQVLDYSFLMTRALGIQVSPAILTPRQPTDELIDLLSSLGIVAIWGSGETFTEISPHGALESSEGTR